jgi:hypothetical protein
MISVVENYIYEKKRVSITINPISILSSQDQLDKLIDAYNHVKTQYPNV